MTEYPKFSVLMSVYAKERSEYLKQSFKSILDQTVLPTELVLVQDGPIPQKLRDIIIDFKLKLAKLEVSMNILSLQSNHGLGYALGIGISQCKCEYIARMDTDDIALPKRFEKQIAFLASHRNIDILGTNSVEFSENLNRLQSNPLPENDTEIKKRLSSRNPFSHPTVMFKRVSVLQAGNYQLCPYFEDYFLWARMINNGAIGHNLPQKLLMSRINDNLYSRRGGLEYVAAIISFRMKLMKLKKIQNLVNIKAMMIQISVALLPNKIRRLLYKDMLRKKDNISVMSDEFINYID